MSDNSLAPVTIYVKAVPPGFAPPILRIPAKVQSEIDQTGRSFYMPSALPRAGGTEK